MQRFCKYLLPQWGAALAVLLMCSFLSSAAPVQADQATTNTPIIVTPAADPRANARMVQNAIDKAVAENGGTIEVQPGIYRGIVYIPKSAHDIALQGMTAGNQRAVFDMKGESASDTGVINVNGGADIKIDGFEIRNFVLGDPPAGIIVSGGAKNVTLSHIEIHHIGSAYNGSQPIFIRGDGGTQATAITGLVITDVYVHDVRLGQNETISVNGNVDGFVVEHNTIENVDNIGIDAIGGEDNSSNPKLDKARNGIIRFNLVRNIDTNRNPTYPRNDESAAGIYVDGASDIQIEYNDVEDTNRGIEISAEHHGLTARNIEVKNNILRGNHMAAVTLGPGEPGDGRVDNVQIENNQFDGNGTRSGVKGIDRQFNIGSYTNTSNGSAAPTMPEQPGIHTSGDGTSGK
jgi:hypothetical protein